MEKKKLLRTTVEEHLENKSEKIIEIFSVLREKIKKIEGVQEKPTDPYIGYYLKVPNKRSRLFVEIHIQIKKIQLHLRRLDYKNKSEISIIDARDANKWTLNKLVDINNLSDLEGIMPLIEQSYNDVLT